MLDSQRPISLIPSGPEAPFAVTAPDGVSTRDWRPAPGSYDWYGPIDPDGLMDCCDPFAAASSPAAPAESASTGSVSANGGQPEISP
jgi:hypothetical protein